MPAPILTCATWNIHRTKGADGRHDPARVVRVLSTEPGFAGLDVLALQEADADCPPHNGLLDLAAVEAATGLTHAQSDPALRWGAASHGFLGAVVFLRPGIAVTHADVIDLPGHCHRGAVAMELALPGGPLRILTTHLSLGQPLRIVQMRILGQYLARRAAMPSVLIGDLNEWRPWGGLALSRLVAGRRWHGPARATFPAARPVLPLDRILAHGARVAAVEVLRSPAIRAASDHLALRGQIVAG
ncbi:MAG: endonuclease/exonuclease/phosphatase family protein [Gemmobacter sp.]